MKLKRVLSVLVAAATVFAMAATASAKTIESPAAESKEQSQVVYLADGSYWEISPAEVIPTISARSIMKYPSFGKKAIYHESGGAAKCALTLRADYEVDYANSVRVSGAWVETETYDGTYWWIENARTKYNGSAGFSATAYGSGTVINRVLFITLVSVPLELSINCDKYGNYFN